MFEERAKNWHKRWERQGIEQGIGRTARNLVATTGLDDATIARVTGLTEAEVGKLSQQWQSGQQ